MTVTSTKFEGSFWARLADRVSANMAGLSLRQRMLLILGFAAMPGIAVAFSLAANKLSEQTRQMETSAMRLARIGAAQHDVVIGKARMLLEGIAARGTDIARDGAACREAAARLPDGQSAFAGLGVYGPDGKAVCVRSESGLPDEAAGKAWFAEARKSEDFVLGDYSVGKSGKAVVAAALPLKNADGGFAGVAAAGIDLRWIDFVASTVQLPERMTISAFDRMGLMLSHNFASKDRGTAEAAPPSEPARRLMTRLAEGTLRADDASGSPRVYGFKSTETGGIVIAVGSPRYAEFVQYGDALLHTLAAPLAILVLALLAAGFAAEMFVTRYVQSMTRTADAVASGDLSERTEVPYDEHEIGELAEAFDDMVENIEGQQKALIAGVERRDVLINELNHRVKNNFQMVLSLLELDRGGLTARQAQARLKGLAGRIHALAEIHRLLYEEYNKRPPSLGHYAHQLGDLLGDVYDGRHKVHVRVNQNAANAELPVAQLISFGLILNELISNANKHAFRSGEPGRIAVSLKGEKGVGKGGADEVHLTVTDNGKGLPDGLDILKTDSMGMRLLNALTRHLGGEVWPERRKNGTVMHVRFLATLERTRRRR